MNQSQNSAPGIPPTPQFTSASIILPVINETVSLRQTMDVILRDVPRESIKEIIIVICKKTIPESMAVIADLQKQYGDLVVVLNQKLPFLGGALRDSFDISRGSHVVMMASDLETDPKDVKSLIEESKKDPAAIIATTRWLVAGQFHGYSKIKLLCNWIFQRFFSILYGTKLTDMTFGFRLLPTNVVQAIQWEEVRHPFNLETIVKPLRLGVTAKEISTGWQARIEGESQNPFFRNFEYFRTGFKTRFASPKSLLKPKA